MRLSSTTAPSVAALTVLAIASYAQTSDGGSAPTAQIIASLPDIPHLRGGAKGSFNIEHPDNLHTVVKFSTDGRYVAFATRKIVVPTLAFSSAKHSVAYQPTEVAWLGSSKLAVAGYCSRGRTIVEVSELATPTQSGSPSELEVSTPAVRSKQLVYEDDIPDERFVSGIAAQVGSGGSAFFVQRSREPSPHNQNARFAGAVKPPSSDLRFLGVRPPSPRAANRPQSWSTRTATMTTPRNETDPAP